MANVRTSPGQKKDRKEPNPVSNQSRERAEAAKAYIEQKYSKMKREESEKKECWEELSRKMQELNLSQTEQHLIRQNILHEEAEQLRLRRKKISVYDFESIAIIGKGAFGEVRLVRSQLTGEVLALKKMNKSEMVHKNQVQHVRAERNVLATADNPWIVELKYSFQDEKFLYLAMEYLAGGDLMTILMKRDILPEDEARFYMAEAILAIESVHKMNYIHRDLKPDNILIDSSGHVKLSDFGLCKHTEITGSNPYSNLRKIDADLRHKAYNERRNEFKRNRKLAFSTVGTPDYIAPEIFRRSGYDETVDWWSLGVIFFEMVVGYPPFFADEPSVTCQKILHWKQTLQVPREAGLSLAATDLIHKLVCEPADRLGSKGVEEIKNHPFFLGVRWDRIRQSRAPWIPELESEIDTSNFDKFDETEPFYPEETQRKRRTRKDVNFIGYTYKREDEESQRSGLVNALQELESVRASASRSSFRPSKKHE